MAGNHRQKKAFALLNIFKSTRRPRIKGDDMSGTDAFVKAYKVYPSDEDRGRWVADPRIDRKASAYIATTQENWSRCEYSN